MTNAKSQLISIEELIKLFINNRKTALINFGVYIIVINVAGFKK